MSVSITRSATPQSVLGQAIVGDNPTTKKQASAAMQDIGTLQHNPNSQAAQSKLSTDFSELAEQEGYSSSDINAIGEAASNLSPNDHLGANEIEDELSAADGTATINQAT